MFKTNFYILRKLWPLSSLRKNRLLTKPPQGSIIMQRSDFFMVVLYTLLLIAFLPIWIILKCIKW